MKRHLFVGMNDEAVAKRSLIFSAIVVLFLLGVLVGSSFLAGYEYRSYLAVEERKAELMRPKKATPATFVPLLDCNARGYVEFRRTCGARARMAEVKP